MNQVIVNEIIGRVKRGKTTPRDLVILKTALTSCDDFIDAKQVEKEDLIAIGPDTGDRLKNERLKAKLTQVDLKRKSKVSQATISKIEKAQKIMTISEAKKLAKALGVTPEYLIAG